MTSPTETDPATIELYGIYGTTHGAARVLTVMSPSGATAVSALVVEGPDVFVDAPPGHLTRYHEKREGALAALVRAHRVRVVAKDEWDGLKARFGQKIYD